MSMWKKLAGQALALLIGFIIAGVLAEIFVLVVAGPQVRFPRHVVGAPWGVRVNEPGASYGHRSPDVDISFRINSKGMRADRDYPYEKPDGVKRIVSLGDSFTIGYEVENEETFASILESRLLAAGHEVEVLNAGVSGYSAAEAAVYLERELVKYDPDIVLVSFCGNDVVDNVRSGLFQLEDGDLLQKRDSYVPASGLGDFLNTNPVFNWLSEHSHAFALLKERATYLAKARMVKDNVRVLEGAERAAGAGAGGGGAAGDGAGGGGAAGGGAGGGGAGEAGRGAGEAGRGAGGGGADVVTGDPAERAREEILADQRRLCGAIYDRILETARSHGAELVVQSIPSYRTQPRQRLLELFPLDDFDTEQPGVHFLRTMPLLEPHLGDVPLYYEQSHGHWTPFAHRISGEALADLIQSEGLLDPR